jgi:hypothetical protein
VTTEIVVGSVFAGLTAYWLLARWRFHELARELGLSADRDAPQIFRGTRRGYELRMWAEPGRRFWTPTPCIAVRFRAPLGLGWYLESDRGPLRPEALAPASDLIDTSALTARTPEKQHLPAVGLDLFVAHRARSRAIDTLGDAKLIQALCSLADHHALYVWDEVAIVVLDGPASKQAATRAIDEAIDLAEQLDSLRGRPSQQFAVYAA